MRHSGWRFPWLGSTWRWKSSAIAGCPSACRRRACASPSWRRVSPAPGTLWGSSAQGLFAGGDTDQRFPGQKDVPDFIDELMGGPGWARYTVEHDQGRVTIVNGANYGCAV